MLQRTNLLLIFLIIACSLSSIVIKDIIFTGVEAFSNVQLKNRIASKIGEDFDQQKANRDSQRLSDLYRSKDIFHVIVSDPIIQIDQQEVILTFIIEEKNPVLIDSLILLGNKYLSSNYIKEKLVNKKFTLAEIPEIIQNIGEIYNERGFLFSAVSLDAIELTNENYRAILNIHEGENVRFKELIIQGNKVTKASTILKLINLEENNILTPQLIDQIRSNISRKTYIKSCNVIPLKGGQLLIEIEEDRMTILSGVLGYSNKSNNKHLSGFVNLNLLNLFGTDRNLEFQWQDNNGDNERIYFSYHESGPNNFPVSGDFQIGREEQDSTSIKTNFESEIYYYNQRYKAGILFGWESIYPGSRRPEIVSNSTAIKAGFLWYFDDLDHQINPTRGQDLAVKFYSHWREVNGKNNRKQAVEASWQINYPILLPAILHGSVDIKTFENKDITAYDYFDIGGLNSIRGYLDNQFSGFRVGWINFEFRYLLNRDSRLFLFSDAGYVESLDQKFGDLFSFGLGLRLNTRIGLLGIDYGIAKENNSFRNPLNGILHFGIETKL